MRIAHLTATFPPYPGGAGNTAARFAAEQAARGHHVEVFTAPAPGEIPDPGGAEVHRIDPVFAIGNAPLIPSLRRDRGLRRRPPPLPVHLRLRADPARPAAPPPALAGAARPLQEPARRRRRPRRDVRGLRALRRSGADPRRRPGLRALRRPRRTRSPTCAGPASASRRSWSRCRTGSTPSSSRPAPTRAASANGSGFPPTPLVAAFVATLDLAHHFKRLDVAIDGARGARRPRRPHRRRRRRRAARRLPRARRRGRRRRARPLPRRGAPRRAARRPARQRPLPADDRAAGVVRHRPDRGDGGRAAGRRHRLPRRARRRRRRDRAAGRARATRTRSPRRSRRWSPPARRRGRGSAPPAARRRSASGAGRGWSSGWTAPTPRRSRRAARGTGERALRILFVAYFYPPCRDTGALRPASMARWLRELGHEVTVLTTSAYGELARRRRPRRPHRRRPAAGGRGCTARTQIGALFDADTYTGRPHPLSRLIVPEPLALAWAAVRAPRRPAAGPRAALRLRDHQLAARVGARDRPGAEAPPRPAVGRRHPRRLELRAAAARVPDRRPEAPRPERSSGAGSATPTPSSASAGRPSTTFATGSGSRAELIAERLGPGDRAGRRGASSGVAARPRPRLARLHRAVRQLRARSGGAGRGARAAGARCARRRPRSSSS